MDQQAVDESWMRKALDIARRGEQQGEVPVGAVVVRGGELIAEAYNAPISLNDPTAHAEVRALREAARRLGNYRLSGSTLYVTIEPCAMCAGAMVHARIARLVFGAREARAGAVVSNLGLLDQPFLNHRVEWRAGVCEDACAELMREFFIQRRGR